MLPRGYLAVPLSLRLLPTTSSAELLENLLCLVKGWSEAYEVQGLLQ